MRNFLVKLASCFALSMAAPVFAASDLTVSLSGLASPMVLLPNAYTAKVRNLGNRTANNVVLRIQLPLTTTSPRVYILGTISGLDPRCQVVSNALSCNLGSINRSASSAVSFQFKFPQSSRSLGFNANVMTSSTENSVTNNAASLFPQLNHPSLSINSDITVQNSHCTGTNLSSYFECQLFPSSIAQHSADYRSDGSISFPDDASFTGSWVLSPNGQQLSFEYLDNGIPVARFSGWAVDGSCFEGITNFLPTSTYMSVYRVCLP